MASNILFLTGAPLSSALEWETADLLNGFLTPVGRFVGTSRPEDPPDGGSLLATSADVSWRALSLVRQNLTTKHSQLYDPMIEYRGNVSFFNTSEARSSSLSIPRSQQSGGNVPGSGSTDEMLSKFYEHSFAIHADVASSHAPALASTQSSLSNLGDSYDGCTSVEDTPGSIPPVQPLLGQPVPTGGHLRDLNDIPNANYLLSIHPQTMTVNLIVGIITISQPRGIKTRHGVDIELLEILVGDETKSGFEITCWLPSSANHNAPDFLSKNLRDILESLRPQDIVLMRNVQLSSFRGKVHGQTLRKGMTKVHLLYRNRIDRKDGGGCYNLDNLESNTQDKDPQVAKTSRVKNWVLRFVGNGLGVIKIIETGRVKAVAEALPPDTQ